MSRTRYPRRVRAIARRTWDERSRAPRTPPVRHHACEWPRDSHVVKQRTLPTPSCAAMEVATITVRRLAAPPG
eukprot:15453856-Alexandrium_andersonii.AAC.1